MRTIKSSSRPGMRGCATSRSQDAIVLTRFGVRIMGGDCRQHGRALLQVRRWSPQHRLRSAVEPSYIEAFATSMPSAKADLGLGLR